MIREFIVDSVEETADAAKKIADDLRFPGCIYLDGEMGVGKTTMTKYILEGLGYKGAVTSPTYNLIQEYSIDQGVVYHMDLYRLDDVSEIEFLGLEDLWSPYSLFLVEWPQKGKGFLPSANGQIGLKFYQDKGQRRRKIIVNI